MQGFEIIYLLCMTWCLYIYMAESTTLQAKVQKFLSLSENQKHIPKSIEAEKTAAFIVKYDFDKPGCNAAQHGRSLSKGGPYKQVRDNLVSPNFANVLSKALGEKLETTKKTLKVDILKPANKHQDGDRHSQSVNYHSEAAFSFLPNLNMESVVLSGDLGRKAMDEDVGITDTTKEVIKGLKSMPCVEQVTLQPKAQLFHELDKSKHASYYGAGNSQSDNHSPAKYPQDDSFQHLWWYMSQNAAIHNYPDGHKFVLPRVQDVHNHIWTGTGSDYLVGVIDTGLDFTHPEFFNEVTKEIQYYFNEAEAGSKFEDFNWLSRCTDMVDDDDNGFTDDCFGLDIIYQWYPWEESSPFPFDLDSHGTHVAGTIAAKTDNKDYVSGACPGCKIVPITPMFIFEALEYAAQTNIKILNMSFGYRRDYIDEEIYNVFKDAFNKYHAATDGLILIAAGNEPYDMDKCGLGESDVPDYCQSNRLYFGFPCQLSLDLPYVVCVGASDYYGKPTVFSTYGKNTVQVFAPGTDIYSTVPIYLMYNSGILRSYRGTSMATPLVAGIAGLLRSKFPDLPASLIRKALVASCKTTTHLKDKSECGGVVDSLRAFAHATVCSQTPNACGQPLQLGIDENDNETILSWFCKKASVFGHNLPFCD